MKKKVSNLFWHPYIEKPLTKDSAEWQAIQNPPGSKKPKYNKEALPRDNNPEILFQVAAKHLVLVFNCFEGLKSLAEDQKQAIEDNFLGDVLEKQGWDKSFPTLDKVKEGIKDKALLDYGQNEYCIKGSENYKAILLKPVAVLGK